MSINPPKRTWRERLALCPPGFIPPCQCIPPIEGGRIACETFRVSDPNKGYSAGLQYRFVYGRHAGTWRVWDRHTGEVVWSWFGSHPVVADWQARAACDRLNGIEILEAEARAMAIAHDDVE